MNNESSNTSNLECISASEYMEFCEPISASCIKDGIPMVGMFRGKTLKGFSCGHCGLGVSVDNKKRHDMSRSPYA